MSIYEDVSKIIAEETSDECFTRYDVGGVISRRQKSVIDEIIRGLRNGEKRVNSSKEIKLVLDASAKDGKARKEGRIADFYMLRDNKEHYFEIKTVKPNIDVFTKSKTKLLEWVARRRSPIKVYLAFPYNPYHPQPYERFTEQGLLDRKKEFLIGEEYWDFLGGKGGLYFVSYDRGFFGLVCYFGRYNFNSKKPFLVISLFTRLVNEKLRKKSSQTFVGLIFDL